MTLTDEQVSLVLARLHGMDFPQDSHAQVCYQLGWQAALVAVRDSLNLPAGEASPAEPEP